MIMIYTDEFLNADKKVKNYLMFCLLIMVFAFVLSPRLKLVADFYFIFIATPGLFLFFKQRCRIPPYSTDFFLWFFFLIWCALQGSILSHNSGGLQYAKHVLYATSFMMVAGRLASPCIFRSEIFARGAFWILMSYIIISWFMEWNYGSYTLNTRIWDLALHTAATVYFSSYLLAAFFALSLPYWLKSERWLELACALVGVIFVQAYLFQHRAGLIALTAVLALAIIMSIRFSVRVCLYFSGMVVSVIGIIASIILYNIPGLIERGSSGRLELWSKYFYEWQQCGIWIGCGPEFKSTLTFLDGIPLAGTHNIFLSFGVYNGLFALLLFCCLCIYTFYKAWKRRDPWGAYLLSGLVALSFDGQGIIRQPNTAWILIFLPMALIFNPSDCDENSLV
jgi:hypothetical protein